MLLNKFTPCAICGIPVQACLEESEIWDGTKIITVMSNETTPSSRYWKMDGTEVYCGAVCSLIGHKKDKLFQNLAGKLSK